MSTDRITPTIRFPGDEDGGLSAILADYLAAIDRGEQPDREALIDRHPKLADQMRAFFASQDHFDQLAEPLRLSGVPPLVDGGAALGPFDLVEEIGRGGMGVVLRGRDRVLDRELAVKVLLERFRDRPDLVRRFVEEARITGSLQHPFIVPVHELGALPDGRPYFAMKLIQGRTLADLLAYRPDPAHDRPRFLKVFEQVCQTLAYAHSRGVIHRDLKPANVMVGAFGEVQVMDWGLAKVLTEAEARTSVGEDPRPLPEGVVPREGTQAGAVLGTFAFMPPEQACGDVGRIDRRSDVFGLGAILCEILTGQPPYTGEVSEVRAKAQDGHTGEALERLGGYGADREVIDLARRCLAADPLARPADGAAIADALGAYLTAVQERLRAAEIARAKAETEAVAEQQRARVEQKRRRATVLLAASLLLFVATASAFGLWFQHQQARQAAERSARLAATERDVTAALGEARLLHEEGVKQADNPERWRPTLKAAWSALKRAEEAVERGEPTDALFAQVAVVRADLEQDERDCQLLADLERVLEDWSAFKDHESGNRFAVRRYEDIFGKYGLDLTGQSAEQAAAQLRVHRFRPRLVEAIECWARFQAHLAGTEDHVLSPKHDGLFVVSIPSWKEAAPLLRVLEALEPNTDSFRCRWREARARRDSAALVKLAESPAALATAPLGLINLAHDLKDLVQMNAATRLLRSGLEHNRHDFWLNFMLSDTLLNGDPPALDEALRYLTAAIALRSRVPFVYLQLSNVLRRKGDLDGAFREARTALALDQNFAPSHHYLGFLHWHRKNFPEAIRCYRMALSLDQDSSVPRLGLGIALLDNGEVEESLRILREGVRLEPKNFSIHNSLGNAWLDKGNLETASACYRNALAIAPQFPLARINLVRVLLRKNDLQGAWQEGQLALARAPKCAELHYLMGGLQLQRGDAAGALRSFRIPTEQDPKSVNAHLHLSGFLMTVGNPEEALRCARTALEIDPKSAPAHVGLMKALLKKGNVAEANRRGQEALALFPNDADVQDSAGMVFYWKGLFDQAASSHRRALELQPGKGVTYENLGLALRADGKLEAALDAFRSAVRFTKTGGEGQPLLAETLLGLARVDDAVEAARKMIDRNAKEPRGYVWLALALLEKGDYGGVREALRRGQAQLPFLDRRHDTFRQLVGQCDLLEKAYRRLPAVLAGTEKPATTTENLALGMVSVCFHKQRHAAAGVRFFQAAFAGQFPGKGPLLGARFEAALCAVIAGTGQSADSVSLAPEARANLRRQAHDWMRDDLGVLKKALASRDPITCAQTHYRLWRWRKDTDLATVRETRELLALPSEEHLTWLAFWTEVDGLQQEP